MPRWIWDAKDSWEDDVTNLVLFVTNDFGPRAGGIETFIHGLIEGIPDKRVIVFTSSQGDTDTYDYMWKEKFGVEIIRDKSTILLPSLRVTRRLKKLCTEKSIGIVVFGAAAPLGLLAPSLRKVGVKRIVALTHGHEVWWAKVPPFSFAIRRIGNSVDVLTYLGEFTRSAIGSALTHKAKDSMVRIAPGIDVEHFFPQSSAGTLRAELGLANKKVIVCLGRLVHRKGQDILIKALPEIRKSVPDAHILFIGEGPYRKNLVKLAHDLEVSQAITFIGRIQYQDLPRYLSVGDIFAMPSRSRFFGLEVEGLGIVYLEASACGLAVIAGASGGAPDAVLQGKTGIVVDGTNVGEVSTSVIDLLSNPTLAKEMGKNGNEWVSQQWRWDIWSQKFAELLISD